MGNLVKIYLWLVNNIKIQITFCIYILLAFTRSLAHVNIDFVKSDDAIKEPYKVHSALYSTTNKFIA